MKNMKFVKTFENYTEEGDMTGAEEIGTFTKIEPKRKLDKDFEIKAESVANLISNCPEYSKLKELALEAAEASEYVDRTWSPGESPLDEYLDELENCFPNLDLKTTQNVSAGTKIPFYGRTKTSSGTSTGVYLPIYIALKVKDPGFKF